MTAPQTCERCPPLVKIRNGVVNGRTVGESPRFMFVGQNPGRNEDEQLKCFVGEAGKVLAELLLRAEIAIDDVYLTNAVRCWTPGNRKPKKAEWSACRDYLIKEIRAVDPDIIIALGETATHSLYGRTSIASVAGQTLMQPDTGVPLMITYHPAFLLRGAWSYTPVVLSHLAKAKRIVEGTLQEEQLGEYLTIRTVDQLRALKDYLLTCPKISVDSETTGLRWMDDEILCLSFSGQIGEGYTVPILRRGPGLSTGRYMPPVPFWDEQAWPDVDDLIDDILGSDVPKILQNGSFDLRFFEREPSRFIAAVTSYGWEVRNITDDTMQMHRATAENLPKELQPNAQPAMLALHTGMPPYEAEVREQSANKRQMDQVENDVTWRYAGADVDGVHRLDPPLTAQLAADGSSRWVYDNLTIPMLRCCQAMTMRGVLVDRPYFDRLIDHHEQLAGGLEAEAEEIAGIPFNFNAPQQVQRVLFDVLGLPKSDHKTGAASDCLDCEDGKCQVHDQVDKASLLEIKAQQDHPILDKIIELRALHKRRGTYLAGTDPDKPGGFLAHIRGDDRIHCQFNTGGAATGRLSSSEPNGQNVPNKVEIDFGKDSYGLVPNAFRRTFIAPPNHVLMEADWSQLEVWILAYRLFETYGDRTLLDILLEGRDVHVFVARNIWPVDPDLDDYEWRKEHEDLRDKAKVFTFGIQYGLTVKGIEDRLQCSETEAVGYLGMYLNLVPSLRNYFQDNHAIILAGDVLENKFGRRRRFPEVPVMQAAGGFRTNRAVEEIMRVGDNFPIQSGGSDFHTLAGHIPSEFTELRNYAKIVLAVHDSCLFEVGYKTEDDIVDVAWKVKQLWQHNAQNLILENGEPLGWQIPVAIHWGDSWGGMTHVLTAKGEVINEEEVAA